MDIAMGQWDRAKLAYWFERHTCDDILRIPLNNLHGNDVLIWKENKLGPEIYGQNSTWCGAETAQPSRWGPLYGWHKWMEIGRAHV